MRRRRRRKCLSMGGGLSSEEADVEDGRFPDGPRGGVFLFDGVPGLESGVDEAEGVRFFAAPEPSDAERDAATVFVFAFPSDDDGFPVGDGECAEWGGDGEDGVIHSSFYLSGKRG